MAAKDVKFSTDARDKMVRGVNILARAKEGDLLCLERRARLIDSFRAAARDVLGAEADRRRT